MGRRFRREGPWVCLWLILVDIRQKTTKFCKVIILLLKKFFEKLLAPWKESYDKPRQCIKKQKHYFLSSKIHIFKAMVLSVVIYGYDSWTIKKPEY